MKWNLLCWTLLSISGFSFSFLYFKKRFQISYRSFASKYFCQVMTNSFLSSFCSEVTRLFIVCQSRPVQVCSFGTTHNMHHRVPGWVKVYLTPKKCAHPRPRRRWELVEKCGQAVSELRKSSATLGPFHRRARSHKAGERPRIQGVHETSIKVEFSSKSRYQEAKMKMSHFLSITANS